MSATPELVTHQSAQPTLTIEAKVLGQRARAGHTWTVELPLPDPATGENITTGALIALVVRHEVRADRERNAQRSLLRILSPADIQAGVAQGKLTMTRFDEEADQPETAEDNAVAVALQAYRDGLFYFFVDEQQLLDLDAPVPLRPDSTLTFLRLVALAGG